MISSKTLFSASCGLSKQVWILGIRRTSFAQDLTGHRHDLQSHQQFEEHFVALIESTVHVPVHLHLFRDIAEKKPAFLK